MGLYASQGNDLESALGHYKKGARRRAGAYVGMKMKGKDIENKCGNPKCGRYMAPHIWAFQKANRPGGPLCLHCDRKEDAKKEGIKAKNEIIFYRRKH